MTASAVVAEPAKKSRTIELFVLGTIETIYLSSSSDFAKENGKFSRFSHFVDDCESKKTIDFGFAVEKSDKYLFIRGTNVSSFPKLTLP